MKNILSLKTNYKRMVIIMKKNLIGCIALICLTGSMFISCGVSNKTVLRYQRMEEGVSNPTSIEEYKEAIEKYQERVADIQLAQQQIGIWYKILGTKYLDNKMYGEALKCFQSALEFYPDNQNLYYWVGVCAGYMSHQALDYGGTGATEIRYNYLKLAEEAYLRAVQIEDRYVRALYGLGVLYVWELEEANKAIPYLEKLLSIDTKNIDAMFLLASAYYSDYDFDKSVEMYDKIIQNTKSASIKAQAEANRKQVLDVQDTSN